MKPTIKYLRRLLEIANNIKSTGDMRSQSAMDLWYASKVLDLKLVNKLSEKAGIVPFMGFPLTPNK